MLPADVGPRLREMAETFRGHAQESVAIAYERSASLIEEALASEIEASLTLQEAAALSGYSGRHLRRLIESGAIPTSGHDKSPRILRSHLPRKPGHGIARHTPEEASSIAQVARAIATRGNDNGST